MHGGRREGAGRPKGALNKATQGIREAAQQYTEQALATLAEVMVSGNSEAARVAAANSLLDRGWGKPRQQPEAATEADFLAEHCDRIQQEVIELFVGPSTDGAPIC